MPVAAFAASTYVIIAPLSSQRENVSVAVEFAFYNLNPEKLHERNSENLFGIIECKKVGVEQTVKQNFKQWQKHRNYGSLVHVTVDSDFST